MNNTYSGVSSLLKLILLVLVLVMVVGVLTGTNKTYTTFTLISSLNSVDQYVIPTDWLGNTWFSSTGISFVDNVVNYLERSFKGMLAVSIGMVNIVGFSFNLINLLFV